MLGAWVIFRGLQHLLALTPTGLFDKAKDTPKVKLAESPKVKETLAPGRPGSGKGYVIEIPVLLVLFNFKKLCTALCTDYYMYSSVVH